MLKTRVLVVDDSVVVRRRICEVLACDPELEVVGSAASGAVALAKIEQLTPDVVTLDVEMDGMSGLDTLRRMRKEWPRVRVIMFSVLTARGAAVTIEALLLGASDYIEKPSAWDVAETMSELASKIRALGPKPEPVPASTASPSVHRALASESGSRLEVLAIGLSTGGPNALLTLVPRLPADFPIAVLIVQHIPPMFTQLLAEGLSQHSSLRVEEAIPGGRVMPGVVWIAPGNQHMSVVRAADGPRLHLSATDPPENFCRPSVDVLFRSVAQVYGQRALGVVMTGMGRDGLVGSKHIKAAGGQIVVQDEATSVVWGMPGFVARANLADAVVPLERLPDEILSRVGVGRIPELEGS